MARSGETDADRELLTYARGLGIEDLTPRMLEDWRRADALPARIPTYLGRGGTRWIDPPGTAARAVGVYQFLHKQGPFGERFDLPCRRRVRDAPVWLWYEGLDGLDELARDRACDYWAGWQEDFGAARRQAAAKNPRTAAYELPVALPTRLPTR